ncbi:unnamed protein product [Vitrella brassicaformis CCMP3155]|uniref:Uncharacterized protein n=1 Tax=Vitrella brassicaformis (strain CCMP3155) TaxID=1169540 RepID=A0A0G4GDZ2_VITBC|nr:unnamed protein product [Vitrella brassicaformis CCMP3155]|eukprot:CEM27202.1 unnamed protein product [Vitrella brassicaformis CCMP3155]
MADRGAKRTAAEAFLDQNVENGWHDRHIVSFDPSVGHGINEGPAGRRLSRDMVVNQQEEDDSGDSDEAEGVDEDSDDDDDSDEGPTLRAPRYKVGTRVSVAAEERRGDSVWVTAAVYDTKETDGGTVVFMREVEGREELEPVTVPHRTKPPPKHNQDLRMGGKTFSWKGKISAGTTTRAQDSTPVVAAGGEGEGKRRRVAFEPAAAAAAASSPSQGRRLPREGLILISGYGVWPLFDNSIAKEAGAQCRQLDIDSSRAADRAFWQAMPVNVAKRWGGRMPKLTRIWCCHPDGEGGWCLAAVTALIEGHTEGRTAMVAEKRRESERRGEASDIPDGSLTTIAFEAVELSDEDMLSVRRINHLSVRRIHPYLPPVCAPPPSLPALTSISGLTARHRFIGSRHWRVPSLERVQAHEHIDTLGPLVGSSRCLRVFDVPSTVGQKAEVLQQVPVAAEEGQPGPLANLEDIGPIEVEGDMMGNLVGWGLWLATFWRTHRLQELESVLVSRGCRRSLKSLKVKFVEPAIVGHMVFEFAEALQTFASAVCVDSVPISFTGAARGDFLMTLYSSLFPAAPSPILKTLMRQLADQATRVTVDFRSSDLATPPTPAMLDMARGLAFNKATSVRVFGVDQPAQAALAPAHPALALIDQIQPMPQASDLTISRRMALAAGIQLASKMPNLRVLYIQDSVLMQEALQAIKAIGSERDLDTVTVSDIWGVGSGGIDTGEHREGIPQITKLVVRLTVPGGVPDLIEFACSSVRSLLRLRCKTVDLRLHGLDAHTRSLLESAVPPQLGSGEGTTILCSQERDTWDGDCLRITAKHDSG